MLLVPKFKLVKGICTMVCCSFLEKSLRIVQVLFVSINLKEERNNHLFITFTKLC